jgi:hypothetical protein
MSSDIFRGSPRPSLGVALEFQLLDARSLALMGACDEVLAEVTPNTRARSSRGSPPAAWRSTAGSAATTPRSSTTWAPGWPLPRGLMADTGCSSAGAAPTRSRIGVINRSSHCPATASWPSVTGSPSAAS